MHKQFTKGSRAAVIGGILAIAAGCQDLDVENLVNADRDRATSNASDVEAFIGGAFFPAMFRSLHATAANEAQGGSILAAFPLIASEFTATLAGNNTLLWWDDFKEPRVRHDNGPLISVGNGPAGPRDFWRLTGQAGSVAFDGLQILNDKPDMRIMEGDIDRTERARAYSKFMQGWAWGYQAIIFDKAHYIPESMTIPGDPNGVLDLARQTLVDWPVLLGHALDAIDEAIAIATANPGSVDFPSFPASQLWFQSKDPISNAQFIQMANTLAARLIVLSARSPQDRAALDWNRVLQYTANGMTFDWEAPLSSTRSSQLMLRSVNNTTAATTNQRIDYRVIGLADQSGRFQQWISSPPSGRDRFDIVTPDRRITGPTPNSNGAYTYYRTDDNGFEPSRGRYLLSAYQWGRHIFRNGISTNNPHQNGSVQLMTATENNLLRAEALLRTGNAAGAAELINISRTRAQTIGGTEYPGLPPVTAAGVPTVDGACVPRQESGACGTLLTAIRYERMLELLATDAIRGFADSRGWGTLPDGTILSWPIPGNALDLYGMEGYSYGGVGEPNTSTFAPAN